MKDLKLNNQIMLKKLNTNQRIQNFCRYDLRREESFNKVTFIMISNFTFLLRVLCINLIIVALWNLPVLQLAALLIVERFYLSNILQKYRKKKHLKSLWYLYPKIIQSAFILIFELTITITYLFVLSDYSKPLPKSV